jgi:hypothetical protein
VRLGKRPPLAGLAAFALGTLLGQAAHLMPPLGVGVRLSMLDAGGRELRRNGCRAESLDRTVRTGR